MESMISDLQTLFQCSGQTMVLDCETTGLEWWKDKIIGVGFYCKELGLQGYIPTLDNHDRDNLISVLRNLSSETVIIIHNAKFDLHFLRMNPRNFTILDTTVMIHLLDSRNKKNLADAENRVLGSNSKREHIAIGKISKISEWSLETVSQYCVNDCVVTFQLAEILYAQLKEWGLINLFWKEMNYQKVLFDAEERGILLDIDFVEKSADKLGQHIKELEVELYDSCGTIFNWRSPWQLSKAIYDGLGISKPKNPFADADGIDRSRFADSGKYKSTCTSTFILTEKIHHPLGELISSIRECDKIRKNFQKWLELKDSNDVLHTNFNQSGTRTGRLSSSKPNLQNVASAVRGRFTQSVYTGSVERTDEFNMRRGIVAREGFLFLSVDYKQMEMRMFGILSKDPFMLNALIAGKDVHMEIALRVWGDCGQEMNRVHREWSKTITFGLIYGMTLGSLMYKLNMNRFEASKVTDQYWGEFPRIKPWMNEIIQTGKTFGFLRYWSGRIWKEDNPIDMYKGCNALIQGGCADLLSIAAIRVDNRHRKYKDSFLISLVHDETISEIPRDKIIQNSKEVCEIMQVPDILEIPFATEAKIGESYGDLYKIPSDLYKEGKEVSFEKITESENPVEKIKELEDIDLEEISEDE